MCKLLLASHRASLSPSSKGASPEWPGHGLAAARMAVPLADMDGAEQQSAEVFTPSRPVRDPQLPVERYASCIWLDVPHSPLSAPAPTPRPTAESVFSRASAHARQPRRVSARRDAMAARPDAHGGQSVGVKTTACRPQGVHHASGKPCFCRKSPVDQEATGRSHHRAATCLWSFEVELCPLPATSATCLTLALRCGCGTRRWRWGGGRRSTCGGRRGPRTWPRSWASVCWSGARSAA